MEGLSEQHAGYTGINPYSKVRYLLDLQNNNFDCCVTLHQD